MTPEGAIAMVASTWGMTSQHLVGSNKARRYVVPRSVAMVLIRDCFSLSLSKIGSLFGGRDHSTVRAAIIRVERLVGQDDNLADRIIQLRASIDLAGIDLAPSPDQARAMAMAISRAVRASLVAVAMTQPERFLAAVGELCGAIGIHPSPEDGGRS
ncbi:helix-turn-helix domain-containing protein [Magnetospirillum sp. 15-1]|uniref:helix-turn-helix domain-containing protein n=1 Tax=Magnetospirillum sp. 15-1 TaxID=1979370 RepID=UPI000BBBD5EB|nr:helix-turn-helix domain-containing protein [Magnetospirillum sp. 15-1]